MHPASNPTAHSRRHVKRLRLRSRPRPAAAGGPTFADRAVPASALADVLSGALPRSTRPVVVVLRTLPPGAAAAGLSPGVYEFRRSHSRTHAFAPLPAAAELAWRVVADPRPLTFASAVILLRQDAPAIRRRMARMTAMAAFLGIRSACVAALVPAILLGAAPSAREVRLHAASAWRCFGTAAVSASASSERETPSFAFLAGPVALGAKCIYSTGRSCDPRSAVRKAEAEAWERQGWATLGATAEGRLPDVPGAIDPRLLVAYSPGQHADAAFPFAPFSTARPYLWSRGVDAQSGERVAVPAECVHAAPALPGTYGRRPHTWSTTSGLGAWTDAEGALCRATLELLERDAFLRYWIAGTPPENLRIDSLPLRAQKRIEALRDAGFGLQVAQVCSTPVAVITVFVQRQHPPLAAITAAADFSAEEALSRALDEAEGRAAHAAAYPRRPIRSPEGAESADGLMRLYQTARFFRRADFYASAPATASFAAAPRPACADWPGLKAWLAGHRLRLLAFELTPPAASVDQGRTPLRVIRAFVPGLLPIWFGHAKEPAGLAAFQDVLQRGRRPKARSSDLLHPFT